MNDKTLSGIDKTSFHEEGVLEGDLQEALREHPEFVEDGLFVISDEFTDWDNSWRYIDLLCIDSDANLVVVELKRADGAHMELQAIRYAAMMANSSTQRIIEGHGRYLRHRGIEGSAEERIRDHLGLALDEDLSVATQRPKIILVSEDFNTEITTSVLWLNQMGLDIQCVRVRTYRYQGKLLLDIDQVIPLPEAEDYLVAARDREQEAQAQQRNAAADPWVPNIDKFVDTVNNLTPTQAGDFKGVVGLLTELLDKNVISAMNHYTATGATISVKGHDGYTLFTVYCTDGTVALETNDKAQEKAPTAWQALSQKLGWGWPSYNSRPYKTGPFDDDDISLLRQICEEARVAFDGDG